MSKKLASSFAALAEYEPKGPTTAQIDKALRLLPLYEASVIPKEKILEILEYNDLIGAD